MPNNLGELIEVQRKKLGLQQKQVAKMVGITNVSLCKVQTGERKSTVNRFYRRDRYDR